jgi:hypothetical protein
MPHVRQDAQQARERAEQRGVRQPDQPQCGSQDGTEGEIHHQLGQEEARNTAGCIGQRLQGRGQLRPPGEAQQAIAQCVLVEQQEDQQDQHDPAFRQCAPEGAEQPRNRLRRRPDLGRRSGDRRRGRRRGHRQPEFPAPLLERPHGQFTHLLDLHEHAGAVVRQVGGDGSQLEGEHRGHRQHPAAHQGHGSDGGGAARQPEAAQLAHQRRDHQAQDQGQRERLQHRLAEMHQGDEAGGGKQPAGGKARAQCSEVHGVRRRPQLRTGTMLKRVTSCERASSWASSAGEVERDRSSATTLKRHSGWLSLKVMLKLSRTTR